MSTVSLPGYRSCERTPSISSDLHNNGHSNRQRSLLPGSFIKESKGRGVILRLNGQEKAERPVYGLGRQVEGTIELSKPDAAQSVEVKIEGKLLLLEIAGRGSATADLCLESMVLWVRDTTTARCPYLLPFSLSLPKTFTHEGKTYPIPPSFHVELPGLPGFTATIEYSISVIVAKPYSNLRVTTFGINFGTTIVSTPFVYYPRSRPSISLPPPLHYFRTGFKPSPDWKPHRSTFQSRSSFRPDIITTLYLPVSRTFCISQSIPFYLTVESSASVSLAAFLPFSPTGNSTSTGKITRIQLMRQSTVDVRYAGLTKTKGEMWRTDCIGEGTFNHVGDGPTWMSFSGQIVINKDVRVTAFRAAGLSVKDCVVFSITPLDISKSAFNELREVIPIRLTTDVWMATAVGGVGFLPWDSLSETGVAVGN